MTQIACTRLKPIPLEGFNVFTRFYAALIMVVDHLTGLN